jgi:transposase, IS30 family
MAKQLSVLERERISQMHDAGSENVEIARELGRARSTISRELRRNALAGEYSAMIAQGLCLQRRRARPWVRKMERPEVADYVREHLVCYWSPDQIAGRSKRDFPDDDRRRISPQTIYAWIGAQPTPQRRHFTTFLRRGGRGTAADDQRGQLSHQVSIEGRPKVVSARRRYGDWEGDTVVGARHSGAVLTLVERKSGYLLTAKSCDRKADRMAKKIESRLGRLPPRLRRTTTFDNGKEFAAHARLSKRLNLKVYFAQPYCSWQRGTNEHTNGLLRQFIPKGTDLHQVSWQELESYTHLINDRPRKRLGYRTPAEVFQPLVAIET